MKYNCRECTFHWDGYSDTFDKVLIHEKTHIKKVANQWLFVTNVTMNTMINAWKRLGCLIAAAKVVKNNQFYLLEK